MERLTPGGQAGPGSGPQRLLTSSFSWDPAASFTSTLDIDAIAVSHTTDCSLSSEPRSMSWEEPGPGPPLLVAHDMESPPMLEPAMEQEQETSSESESESEESEDSGSSSSSCSSLESDASSDEEAEIINANRRTRKSSGGARKSYKSQQHSSKETAKSVAPSQSCPSPPVLQKHGSSAPSRHLSGQSSRNRQRSGSTKGSMTTLLPHKSDMTLESCPVPEKEEKISITNNLQGILLHKKDTTALSKSSRTTETYSRSQFVNNAFVDRKKPSSPDRDIYQDARIRPNTKDMSCDDSDADSDCMILETSPKLKSWPRPHSDGAEYKHKQSLISGIYRPKHSERGSGHKQTEPHLLALSPPILSEPSNSEAESNAEEDSVSDSGSASASSASSSEAEAEEAIVTASTVNRLSSNSEEDKEDNSGTNSSSEESLPPPLLEPQILDDSLSFKFESNKVKIKEEKKKKYLRKQARVECGSQTELLSSRVSQPRSASPSPDDLVTQSAAPPVLFGFGFKEPRHKRGRPRKNPPTLQPELPVPGEPEPVTSDTSAEESCQEKEETKFVTGKPTVYFPSSSSTFKRNRGVERERHDDGVYEFTDDSNAAIDYHHGPSSASDSEDLRSKICDRKHSKAPSFKGSKRDKHDASLSHLEPVKDRGGKRKSGTHQESSFSGLVLKGNERMGGSQSRQRPRSDHDEIESVDNSEPSRPCSRVTDSESSSIRDYSDRFNKKVVLKGEKKPTTQQVFRQFSTKVNQNFGKTSDLIFPKRFCTLKPDAFWKLKKRRNSCDEVSVKPETQADPRDNSATNSVATKASLKEMPSCPRNQLQQMMSVLASASATRVNSKAVKGTKKEKDCKKTEPDFRDKSAYDSANDTLSEDEESNNGRRKNKKGWRSKHKNVVDPVFLGELEHLIRDISSVQLELKPSRDFWPDRPSDCVPSIFKRRKIFSNKKKREIHKTRRGRSSKNSDSGKIEIDLTNEADADEQRLPLKKRHHHLQGREGSKEASSKEHDSAARQQGLIKVKTPEKIIREFKNSSLNTASISVKGVPGPEVKTVQEKPTRKPTAADRIVEKLGIQIKKEHCVGRSYGSRKTSDLEITSKDDQVKSLPGSAVSRELSGLPSVQIKSESKVKDSRLNKQESATFVENIQGCIDKYTTSSELARRRPLSFNNQQELYKSEPNLTNTGNRRDTVSAKNSVPSFSSPEPDVSGRDSALSQYSNSSDCVVVESQDRDEGSTTGRRARVGRSSRQDLHSHLWRQSDTHSPEPSTSSTLLGSTFGNKADTVTKHVAAFRGQAPVLPESLCHPMPSKPLPTEPIRRVDLGPLGSFGHKTGFLGSQECLIRKVPQAIVAPFRRAPPASSASSPAAPVIPIHRASIPTTATVSVSPSSSVVTQASLESSGLPPVARSGQLSPDAHQEPVQRKENWASSSKEASSVRPPSVREPGAGDSSVSAITGPSLVTPQDKMQSKIKKCQVAVERLRQNSIAKPHAVNVVEPEDALEADTDISSNSVITNSNSIEPSGAVLNIEVTAENSAGLNIVSADRSSKENKCSNNKLESAIKKKEGNDNDSSELLTKVSGGNLNEGKITSLNKTESTEPEKNIIKSRKRRRKTNKTGFPTKVKKKKVLTNSSKTENETVVASDANKNLNIYPDIMLPAPALHPGCDGSGKFDKRDTFKVSAANIETDPSRQSTSGRPLRVCRVQEDTADEEKVETKTNKSLSEVRVKREKRLRSSDDGKERKKIRRLSSKRSKQSSSKGTSNSYEPSTVNCDEESVDFRSYIDAMEMDVGDFLTTLPSSEDSLLSPSLSESSEQQPGDKLRKSKPDIELKKNFIKAGLFSQDYKTEKLRKNLSDGENNLVKTKGTMYNPTEHPFSLLPPPYYCGRQLRQKKEDFALPFDLWSLHSSDSLPNRDILAGQNYKRIKTNIFYDVKQSGDYETPACHCKPPTEQEKPACGKSCLNRMTFTECDPDSCSLGDRCSNMAIQKQKSSVTVQRFMTRDKGWGIKTRTIVVKGTFIMEYLGEVVTDKEFKRRMQTDYKHDSHHYCLHVGEGLVIDGYRMGGECRFVNHSCAPNCEMQKWSVNGVWRMALFSKVPIDINEELTYDYNFSWFDTREGQTCHCGAAECRGIIGGKGKKTTKSPKSSKSSNSNEEQKSKKSSDDSEPQKERNQKSQFTMEHLNHSSLNQFVPIKSMSTNQKDFCRKHSVLLLRNLEKIKRMRDLFFYGEGNVTGRAYTKPTSKRVSGKGMNIEQNEVAPVSSEHNLVKPENEENFKNNQSLPPLVKSVQTRLLPFNSENSSPSKVTKISNIFQNIMDKLSSLNDEQGKTLVGNFDKAPKKEESPWYHIKITEHIDFSIIRTCLNAGSYHSVTQIDQDILLLFQNNIRFYGLSHQFGKYANELRLLYKGVSQEHRATLTEIVGDRDVLCLTGPEVIRREEEDVINCGCGQFRDEGVMIQCDKCECWQHTDCVLPDLKEGEEPPDNWICFKCDPEKKDRTPVDIALVPQPEFAGPGEIYNVFMMREDGMQLKLGMTVYVLRAPKVEDDIKEAKREGEDNITVGHGGIPHKSISPIKGPSKEAESLHAGNYPTYKSVNADLVSTQDMDIFRVERLWVNEAGKKFAFGYHYLRPHETFHEPSRKFYDNEVFRVPLYEVLPLDTIWKQCWVMDPVTFCRGRPNEAREEDVYICEHRVDKTARLFNKISKHKHPTCTKFYTFTEFDLKLKILRSYTPHQLPAKSTIPKGTKKVSSDNQEMEVTSLNKKKLKMKKFYPKIVFKKRTSASVESVSKNLLLSLKDSEPLDLSNLLHGMKKKARAVNI